MEAIATFFEIIINNRIGVAILGTALALFGYINYSNLHRTLHRYPPSLYFQIPFLGHLPYLFTVNQQTSHTFFTNLSKQLGDIFYLRLGSRDVIVLNSFELIREFFVNNSKIFSSRPHIHTVEVPLPRGTDFIFGSVNVRKFHRKFAVKHLLLPRHLSSIESIASAEMKRSIELLKAYDGKEFFPHTYFKRISMSIISKLVFGISFDDPNDPTFLALLNAFDEMFENSIGNLADYSKLFEYLPNEGIRKIKEATRVRDSFFLPWIAQHKLSIPQEEEEVKDYVDRLLYERAKAEEEGDKKTAEMLSDDMILGVCHDLFGAGTDSSSTTLEWLLLFLSSHPHVQSKLHSLLDQSFPSDKEEITYAEANGIEYIHMIINETIRFASITPHLLPHTPDVDAYVSDYFIPRGAIVIPNVHSINNNKEEWEEGDEFRPERFEKMAFAAGWGNTNTPAAQKIDSPFIPFGLGPRQCLGLKMARLELVMVVANLFWHFKFTKKEGEELDYKTQYYGVTMQPRTYSLIVSHRR